MQRVTIADTDTKGCVKCSVLFHFVGAVSIVVVGVSGGSPVVGRVVGDVVLVSRVVDVGRGCVGT